MKITAVVPAYNESRTIRGVVLALRQKVSEVVVVDDGSSDDTCRIAQAAGAVAVRHFLNRGQGAALQTGLRLALIRGSDIVVTFDADGQHDPEDIKKLVEPIQKGEAEVVLGSRFLNKHTEIPLFRFLVLKCAVIFTRLTTGLKVSDTHNGLRAFSLPAAEKIHMYQDGMAHASEILEQIAALQLRFREVPVTIRYTEYSIAKGQRLSNSFRILWDVLVGKFSK